MQKKYLKYLSDPVGGGEFKVEVFDEKLGRIRSGILFGKKNWYPIIEFIPRFLTGELRVSLLQQKHWFYDKYFKKLNIKVRLEWKNEINKIGDWDAFNKHQKETANSFSFEWRNIYRENDFEKNNFFHFMGPYIKEKDLSGLVTVDIGCGSGRFTKWAALSGTKVSFGMDLGDSVEVAYEMTKEMDNVCIVQADIYHPPFDGVFDLAYSIGVLHHLPQPKRGFLSLPKVLKSGGRMLIWVYSRRNNNRALFFYEPIRSITNKMNKRLLYMACYFPALIVHFINYLTLGLNFIGAKKLAGKVPFFYYANFPFNMKLNDAFDVLATPKSNYYFLEEIKEWFEEAKLLKIRAFEHPEAGITCIGEYGQKT